MCNTVAIIFVKINTVQNRFCFIYDTVSQQLGRHQQEHSVENTPARTQYRIAHSTKLSRPNYVL